MQIFWAIMCYNEYKIHLFIFFSPYYLRMCRKMCNFAKHNSSGKYE